ncbi:hypothetical protein HJC23_013332 [Cyclotella cryptica]|uniref:Nitronate monooxygenase domain-containing protein n=1 Tax=Cyclotella cryptica TaxID=29204 RepID=A0ABD3Q6D7_9STRA
MTFNLRRMAGVSGGLLAAQVCKAGALGFIAAGHFQDLSKLEAEIKLFIDIVERSSGADCNARPCIRPSIGFIGHSSLSSPKHWENYEYILEKYSPMAVQFFAPSIITRQDGTSNVDLAHKYGAKFIAQVGSVKHAKEAIQHKVDAIICQGSEAGGHGLRRELANSAMALSSQCKQLFQDIPILAAGAIVNGQHLASALCICDGAVIGTRLWASHESMGDKILQRELTKENSCDDVVKTAVFDQIENEFKDFRWPYPFDASGVLRNRTTDEWEGRTSEDLDGALQKTDLFHTYKTAINTHNPEIITVYAGEGVGQIARIDHAYDLILQMEREAIDTIKRLQVIIN